MIKILSILIVISAALAIFVRHNNMLQYYDYLKPLTTFLIILIPLLSLQHGGSKSYQLIIAAALVFCLIGDVFLLREQYFIQGLGAFLIGHLLFTSALIQHSGLQFNWIAFLSISLIGFLYFYYLKSHNLGNYLYPVLLYFCAIMLMMVQAISLAIDVEQSIFVYVAIASILFAFSDSVIAFDKFIQEKEYSEMAILSTYWTAIYIFAFSTTRL